MAVYLVNVSIKRHKLLLWQEHRADSVQIYYSSLFVEGVRGARAESKSYSWKLKPSESLKPPSKPSPAFQLMRMRN